MPPRFHVPEARDGESAVVLPPDEALHLTRVLRLTAGAPVRVFNGRGDEWTGRVGDLTKTRVTVQLDARAAPAREARVAITLAQAVLKGDKMDDVVRDAVMLGVTRVQPLITTRTEISRAAIARSGRVARWQRVAIASAKQCGRAVVPEIAAPCALAECDTLSTAVLLAEPSFKEAVPLRDIAARDALTVIVGPEGGWTAEEVALASSRGAMLVTLGGPTLRADAVPIVALTALRVRLEDF